MLCLLLTGCTVLVDGRSAPADHDGPVPVPNSALRRALLDGDELDTALDASGIEKKAIREDLSADSTSFSDPSCLAAWQPIQESVYDDSDWSAVRAAVLHDHADVDAADNLIVEAVVGFPARSDAAGFFDQVKPEWESCGDRQFITHRSDGLETEWDFDTVQSTGSTLSVIRTQLHTNGWSCQRALRATNNVIIDVVACAYDVVDDDGVAVVDAIDAKLPSV